jgi:hypothetical protein
MQGEILSGIAVLASGPGSRTGVRPLRPDVV